MGRRAKPAKGKGEAKRPLSRKSPKDEGAKVRDLQKRLTESLEREKATGEILQEKDRALAEALEQQTATAEILRVISQSQTDVRPVFDTIVQNARGLCGADTVAVLTFDGDTIRLEALDNANPEQADALRWADRMPANRGHATGRAILTSRPVHIPDVREDPDYALDTLRDAMGLRSVLSVPMVRDGVPIGAITVQRWGTPRPFSDKQIDLLKTFADQAVIAVENVRLFTELQAKNLALTQAHAQVTEALEQQTATSEILRVISNSPTDAQPVFDAIAASATRLCDCVYSVVFRYDGEVITVAAENGRSAETSAVIRSAYPAPPGRRTLAARALLERRVIAVTDAQDSRENPDTAERARAIGYRAGLSVPMMCGDVAIGVINAIRVEAIPFTDTQIELLKTFADQAVIAIENVRLFKELEAKNRDLTDALEQQTATSEILRVISQSQTDVQPVFDAIVQSAVRLLRAHSGMLGQIAGEQLELAAFTSISETYDSAMRTYWPRPLNSHGAHTLAIRDREPVNIADAASDPRVPEDGRAVVRVHDIRSVVSVPLLWHGEAIGTIAVNRREVGGFTGDEIGLLKTFADQAVIAIGNVRLFTELQASNRDLTAALDTQTATSDILRVISRSQTDVQPVFDAIVTSAVRLLSAHSGALSRIAGDQIDLAALTSTDAAGDATLRARFPQSLHSEWVHAQVIRARVPLNTADIQSDPRVPEATRAMARARGYQSVAVVPLLHHDEAVGAIAVTRQEPGGFTDDEIALLKTFADQAVIAIENARLFSELQARTQELTRSVDQLTALGDVGRAVSSSLDLDTVLTTIVGRAVQLSGADGGTIFEYDEGTEEFAPRAMLNADESQSAILRATRLRRGEGAVGQMAVTREPIQIPDIAEEGAYESRLRGALLGAGTRALLAIPLLHEERIVGGLVVSRRTPGEFTVEVVEILRTFATQSALAIQNARLFKEVEVKSRELEAASQHKSEFLANMSHELRTPLNAIIGYSELLAEEAADLDGGRLVPDLQKIAAAAKHQLSLINDILDLSKVEAGRMELELSEFDLPNAIENALILVRERASRRGIKLGSTIDERVGTIGGDERKVKQVLLNLLSNALKFTPEGGRIDVSAGAHDEVAEVSVADTGVGIAPEDQEAVFEEFRQVGTADKKVEGTGLGLALARKFIELHGGRIWVKSQVGQGSTFTFTLPVRRGG